MFLEDYNCAICVDSTEETLLHLFLDCPFAMECCETLGSTVQHFDDPFQTISSFRIQLVVPFSMEIITSMCWPSGLSEMIQSSEMFSQQLPKLGITSELILLKLSLEQSVHMNPILNNG
jgi:hypothetical protein